MKSSRTGVPRGFRRTICPLPCIQPTCAIRAPPLGLGIATSGGRVILMILSGEKFVPVPPKFQLVLLIHAHQPCGNFEHVLEQSYLRCYLPFLETLEKHPTIHLGLHYSGPLLPSIEEHLPEYFHPLNPLLHLAPPQLAPPLS